GPRMRGLAGRRPRPAGRHIEIRLAIQRAHPGRGSGGLVTPGAAACGFRPLRRNAFSARAGPHTGRNIYNHTETSMKTAYSPRRRHSPGRSLTLAALATTALALAPAPAPAQQWPSKPVTVIVNFPPGGAADKIARAITQPLSETLGQSFVVENKAGAGGNIG